MDTKLLFARVVCWFLFLTAATAAQVPIDNPLVSLFADLRQNRGVVSLEAEKSLQTVITSIPSLPAEQVNRAIPGIVAALSAQEERVQGLAALACFAVIQRPDGTSLLAQDLPKIARLLESPSVRLGNLAGLVLLNAKATLSANAMSRIVATINQESRSAAERVPALATAAGLAPADPNVVEAASRFLREPMDASTKTAALKSIRTSLLDGAALRLDVMTSLHDSDVQVKLSAISVLARMGRAAVEDAKFELQRLTQRETESTDVRGAAAKALRLIQ